MLTLPYSYNWQIFNNKMNKKKKPGVPEYGYPEYIIRQIISRIALLLRRFYCLTFAPP